MGIARTIISARRLTKGGLAGVFLLVLAACQAPAIPPPLEPLTFSHHEPINLNVARLDIDERYIPPLKSPNVEHIFTTSPAKAIRQWAKDRLRPVGDSGTVRLVIRDASAVETRLEIRQGVRGALTKDQSERYDVELDVVLEVLDESGRQLAFANAEAMRAQTVREDISIYDREAVFLELVRLLIEDVNAQLEKNISQFLVNFVR